MYGHLHTCTEKSQTGYVVGTGSAKTMKNQATERIVGYLFLPYLAQTKIESSFIEITIFFDMGGGKPPKIASSFINRMHSATFDRWRRSPIQKLFSNNNSFLHH